MGHSHIRSSKTRNRWTISRLKDSQITTMKALTALLLLPMAAFAADDVTAMAHAGISADQLNFFEKNIRPVLVEHCYKCHSSESDKIKGGLTLDTKQGSVLGG